VKLLGSPDIVLNFSTKQTLKTSCTSLTTVFTHFR